MDEIEDHDVKENQQTWKAKYPMFSLICETQIHKTNQPSKKI
jgi:hypothetical protein